VHTVIAASIAIGVLWDVLVVRLMGGRLIDALAPAWLLAGSIAGVVAGLFTIRTRQWQEGRETVLHGIATYYLGMVVYWGSFVVLQRILLSIQHRGWTDFDLQDHLTLILLFLAYGTLPFGLLLIPLTFLSRYVLWKLYTESSA
jgi:hypothetical protein